MVVYKSSSGRDRRSHMLKTVIMEKEDLFREYECNLFSQKSGKRTMEPAKLKLAKLGNSLTWFYAIEEDKKVSFYRLDREGNFHDETEVYSECGCTDEIYAGDYIWFKSDGMYSTWGKMIPPKNPARRALWERFCFIPKPCCQTNLTHEQFANMLDQWEDECLQANSQHSTFDVMRIRTIYDDKSNPVLSVLVRRNWSKQNWRIARLAASIELSQDDLYDETVIMMQMVDSINEAIHRNSRFNAVKKVAAHAVAAAAIL
jgi:hypothetical protein